MSESRVIPMLTYEDGVAALEFLVMAFGFVEMERWLDDDGRLSHGELEIGGQRVFLAQGPAGYQSPKTQAQHYPPAAEWQKSPYVINGVLVTVDDVDALLDRAKAAGVDILSGPDDAPPGRLFRCADLEGQRWMFLQPA